MVPFHKVVSFCDFALLVCDFLSSKFTFFVILFHLNDIFVFSLKVLSECFRAGEIRPRGASSFLSLLKKLQGIFKTRNSK